MTNQDTILNMGYEFVADMGDYDFYVRDAVGTYYVDCYVRFHDNVNKADYETTMEKDDYRVIKFAIEKGETPGPYLNEQLGL